MFSKAVVAPGGGRFHCVSIPLDPGCGRRARCAQSAALAKRSAGTSDRETPSQAREPAGAPNLRGQVEALDRRLAALEDEETIARLAQSGKEQLVETELSAALDRIADPGAPPEARLDGWKRLRRLAKTNPALVKEAVGGRTFEERDLVLPMLELAQDTTLDSKFRADVDRDRRPSSVVRRPSSVTVDRERCRDLLDGG